MGRDHGVTTSTHVDRDMAQRIATLLAALATPSRVRILATLRNRACTVTDLTDAVEMEQSAVSHQLRILRDLDLIRGRRNGRHVIYELHDPHVETLLHEAVRHIHHADDAGEPDDEALHVVV